MPFSQWRQLIYYPVVRVFLNKQRFLHVKWGAWVTSSHFINYEVLYKCEILIILLDDLVNLFQLWNSISIYHFPKGSASRSVDVPQATSNPSRAPQGRGTHACGLEPQFQPGLFYPHTWSAIHNSTELIHANPINDSTEWKGHNRKGGLSPWLQPVGAFISTCRTTASSTAIGAGCDRCQRKVGCWGAFFCTCSTAPTHLQTRFSALLAQLGAQGPQTFELPNLHICLCLQISARGHQSLEFLAVFFPSQLNNQFLYDCMTRLCSLTQPGTESNIFFFFIYTVSCFRKDLKRGDKHLVNTLDQMLETVRCCGKCEREHFFPPYS